MRTSDWSIRSKIIALLLIPLVALVGLWLAATTATMGPAVNLLNAEITANSAAAPTEELVTALQGERRLSMMAIGRGRVDRPLVDQRRTTDAAVTKFDRFVSSEDLAEAAGPWGRQRISAFRDALNRLKTLRESVDNETISRHSVLADYTAIIDAAYRLLSALIPVQDAELARDSRTALTLGRARDVLAQQDALVAGIAAAGNRLSDGDPARLSQLVGTRRALTAEAAAELPDKHRGTYRGIATSVAFRELQRYENALVQREVGDRLAVAYGRWQPVYESVDKQLREFETELKDEVSQRVASQTNGLLVRLAVIGFTGLAAVIVTIALTFVWGRAVIRQLVALRKAAQELSRKLPEVVARLRRGESADDVVEPSALVRRGDEIGDVARALADSQQAVVAAASGEARLRQGFHEVFLNIARRNQALLHRQFTVLDEMERRTVDVQDLEDLFRIDHLATRMRRNAENLVILAGAHPGRGWRDPIPMIDVIRGAISEIEDYARVKVTRVPDAALAGHAVADVIHLLAELLENATSFSPPHARVTISGELAATGYVVEIEDRGLGMDAETIAELNRKLAEPPDFDPATSERLGIFVVSLLAARHRIKVSLRPSPYGGTTAITFVPRDLLADPHARALPAARARADATTPSAAETAEVPALTGTGGPTAGDGAQPAKVRAALPRRHVAKQDDEKQDDAMQDHVSEPAPDPVEERSRPPRPRPSSDTTRANLPRRRRQTHLAPQLATAPPETTPDSGDADTAERSPEEIRRLMSSFQAGMTRGRAEAGTSDDDLSFPEDDTDEAGNHSPWRTEGDR